MRTVKVKKEIKRLYSFATEGEHWVRDDRDVIEEVRGSVAGDENIEGPLSDVVETIYYAEALELVPDVYEMWYFACVKGQEKPHLCYDYNKEELIESRNRHTEAEYSCSEIKLLREEF